MHRVRFACSAAVLGMLFFVAEVARAGNPLGGCSEETYGAACNHDGTSSCSGVCLPDFSQAGAPMSCLATDASVLAGLGIPSLDGAGCSPSGASGSDCSHRCTGGQCVATNAAAGAECLLPDGGANTYGEINICNSACDGAGSCAVVDHGGDKYGRGQLDYCTYIACNPLAANAPGGHEFPTPAGISCGDGFDCMTGQECNATGECVGGTPVEDCGGGDAGEGTLDDKDAAVGSGVGAHGRDASTSTGDIADGGRTTTSGSGGCSVSGSRGRSHGAGIAMFLLLAAACVRRRRGAASDHVSRLAAP